MTERYSRVTSIGGDCQVGWQVRQAFANPIPSPFDWIVTPWWSLGAILQDKGERFGQAVSALAAAPPFAAESTLCSNYGCSYHHDFPHDELGSVIITEPILADVRSKMLHKWRSFEETINAADAALFVRLGTFKTPPIAWPYLQEDAPILTSQVNNLQRLLSKTFPLVDCHLLQVIYPETSRYEIDEPLSASVTLRELPLLPGLNWQGDTASWRDIFDEFKHYEG